MVWYGMVWYIQFGLVPSSSHNHRHNRDIPSMFLLLHLSLSLPLLLHLAQPDTKSQHPAALIVSTETAHYHDSPREAATACAAQTWP